MDYGEQTRSKVYKKKVLWYTKTIRFFIKRLKIVAKCCLNWILLSMATSIIVLDAQIWNIKMRSSKLIVESDAQKVIAKFGFGHRFHDLKYFEVGFFFHVCWIPNKLEGHHCRFFVENYQFNIIWSCFKQIVDNYLFNCTYSHTTCTIF